MNWGSPKGQWQSYCRLGPYTLVVGFGFPETVHGPSLADVVSLVSSREEERGVIASSQRGWAHTPGDEIIFPRLQFTGLLGVDYDPNLAGGVLVFLTIWVAHRLIPLMIGFKEHLLNGTDFQSGSYLH